MADQITETTNQILPNEKVDVVAYGCTSGTIEIGEERIKYEINKSKSDALITTPITAAIKALKKLDINKISLFTPYSKKLNDEVLDYFKDEGFEKEIKKLDCPEE